jgi:hypothetical protein
MPCYITGSAEGDARLSASESHAKATEMADMLCSLCERIEKHKISIVLPDKVQLWWDNHKKIDAERIKRENKEAARLRLKANAIAKLSDDERKALGL